MGARIDFRLAVALAEQLEHRRAALARGARHVGWKLGMGDRESIGGQIAVGYLTSETVVDSAAPYWADDGAELHADAEAMVELGNDVDPSAGPDAVADAIARYGAALEIVDLAPVAGEPESVVATNVFHRVVAFGDLSSTPTEELKVTLSVNGRVQAYGRWPRDLPERLQKAALVLAAGDEQLRAGDRIIAGSIVQVPIQAGDRVAAAFGEIVTVQLKIAGPSARPAAR